MAIDETKLNDFLGRFGVADLGAAFHTTNVIIGDRLELYRALAEIGPASSAQLAERTGTAARPVLGGFGARRPARLRQLRATENADADRWWLTEGAGLRLAAPDDLSLPGAFVLAASTVKDEGKITESFRTGARPALGREHHPDLFCGRAVLPPRLPSQPGQRLAARPPGEGVEAKLTAAPLSGRRGLRLLGRPPS